MNLESMYYAAKNRGDEVEAARLLRLIQRLDDQRQAYGKAMRGDYEKANHTKAN